MLTLLLAILPAMLLACGDKDAGDGATGGDAGVADGGGTDGAATDGGGTDGGTADGGTTDGGTSDGGTSDGGTTDGGTSDGGSGTWVSDCPPPGDIYIGCTEGQTTYTISGSLGATTSWTYDHIGYPDEGETDNDSDGRPESRFDYTHNLAGNRTYEVSYSPATAVDPWYELTTDTSDGLVQSVHTQFSSGKPVNNWQWYDREDDGRLEQIRTDLGGDGVDDIICVLTWEPTDEGLASTYDCDTGSSVYAFQEIYDDRGNLVIRRWDLDGSHSWYSTQVITFDGCQRLSGLTTYDTDIVSYTYDRIELEWSYDADDRETAQTTEYIDTTGAVAGYDILAASTHTCP